MNEDTHEDTHLDGADGATPPRVRLGVTPDEAASPGDGISVARAAFRLLLGVALEGGDELGRRLRRWEAAGRAAALTDAEPARDAGGTTGTPVATRRALLGVVLEGEGYARRGLAAVRQASAESARFVAAARRRAGRFGPTAPLVRRFDVRLARARAGVGRLAELGRREEREGRLLARAAAAQSYDEALDVLGRDPRARELVARHGAGLAADAVDEVVSGVRERAASADAWVDRITRGWIRRPGGEHPSLGEPGSLPAHPPA